MSNAGKPVILGIKHITKNYTPDMDAARLIRRELNELLKRNPNGTIAIPTGDAIYTTCAEAATMLGLNVIPIGSNHLKRIYPSWTSPISELDTRTSSLNPQRSDIVMHSANINSCIRTIRTNRPDLVIVPVRHALEMQKTFENTHHVILQAPIREEEREINERNRRKYSELYRKIDAHRARRFSEE